MKALYIKSGEYSKAMLSVRFVLLNAYVKSQKRYKLNKLTVHLKNQSNNNNNNNERKYLK